MGDSLDPIIVGVVKDIYTSSVRRTIKPMIFNMHPHDAIFNVLARIAPDSSAATLTMLEAKWRKLFPDKPYDPGFVKEDFARTYHYDRQWESAVRTSAILSAFIACLGLFGLSTQRVVGRTKEIGIHKVHGASVSNILALISREFLLLVLASNLIAWPLAFIVMKDWMDGFAYRTNISIDAFLLSAVISFSAALLAVASQTIRAATANPVKTIRYE